MLLKGGATHRHVPSARVHYAHVVLLPCTIMVFTTFIRHYTRVYAVENTHTAYQAFVY